jgi:nucleoside-diphosphate-sugar epimerase
MPQLLALVTGGGGFIGRVLTRALMAHGWTVAHLCRTASRPPGDGAILRVDRWDRDGLLRAVEDYRCDAVFHLAAYGVRPDQRDNKALFDVNVGGTAAAVIAAAAAGARAFVYTGSCSEYGEARPGTLIDEDHPLTADGLYGASKAAGGLWGQAAATEAGLHFQWMRLFGAFGSGEAPHRLLPAIVAKLSRDEPVALSPGDQVRDLLYVDDVADGLIAAAEAALDGTTGPFNLCSGEPVSVKQVADAVADALDKPRRLLEFGAIPYRENETLWQVGNPERFRRATGFRARTTLQAGIQRTVSALLGQTKAKASGGSG